LEVRRIVLSNIWNNGQQYNALGVVKGDLFLPLRLQFLFAQYGWLKHVTQPLISKGCGAWNGKQLVDRTYFCE
jgi:hypothetical protein